MAVGSSNSSNRISDRKNPIWAGGIVLIIVVVGVIFVIVFRGGNSATTPIQTTAPVTLSPTSGHPTPTPTITTIVTFKSKLVANFMSPNDSVGVNVAVSGDTLAV